MLSSHLCLLSDKCNTCIHSGVVPKSIMFKCLLFVGKDTNILAIHINSDSYHLCCLNQLVVCVYHVDFYPISIVTQNLTFQLDYIPTLSYITRPCQLVDSKASNTHSQLSWIEYSATNRAVEGSNPSECAIQEKAYQKWQAFFCGCLQDLNFLS